VQDLSYYSLPVEQAVLPDHLSFTALRTYLDCPLRYRFRYLDCLPVEAVNSSLVFGGAFHRALEHHFNCLLAGEHAPDLDTLLEVFWSGWSDYGEKTILLGKTEDVSTIGRLAERMFRAFAASSLARPRGTIVAVEEEFRGQLLPGLPDLLARVDLVVHTDDGLVVTDFKTSRSGWGDDQVVGAAEQLLLYHDLVQPLAEGQPLRLEFAVFTKTKVPDLAIHHVPADAQQLERTKRVAERIWRAIEAQHFYPAPSPVNCPRCPYRKPCRDWAG
jgi:putative RecB family exonuclease